MHSEAGHDSPSDQIVYEQEERPLVNMEDLGMGDAPITHIAAEPSLLRRRSTMSRLGSRLLPDPVLRGLLSSGEETPAEGQALRHGNSSTRQSPSVWERRLPQNTSRISLRDSLRNRSITRTDTRHSVIRGPFPIDENEHPNLPSELPAEQSAHAQDRPEYEAIIPRTNLLRTRTRLNRFRNSLSFPFLGSSQDRTQSGQTTRQVPRRSSRVTFADDSDHLLPPLSVMDHRLDMDDSPHELDAVEPETRNVLSPSRITQGMSTIRRFPHGLRSRSTRLIRRGEHPPLSQVLQLAAAAIAAQLSGHAQSGAGVRPLAGGDAFDGSIQNFVQTLQEAASAQAGENIDLNAADGDLPPVNFMRVFQFPNDENGAPITSQPQMRTLGTEAMDLDNNDSDRSVTLVLVGVRSMPHGQDGTGENAGPSLDTLLSLPFLPPTNVMRNGSSGALFRRSDGRSRTSNRRHSMTNFNFPAQYESQRHQRTRVGTNRNSLERGTLTPSTTTNTIPSIISESPPGPRPPPSTPADMRSGTATPDRRPSSASAAQPPVTAPESSAVEGVPSGTAAESPFNTARQRRRSDSEFARRPELSSGAARRNGVVEPDNPPPGGRSWLIYVVGTNVPSGHPAIFLPSLYTDNPSYEDMQMLSTLLGPAKPPVANPEDVDLAGGLYRLVLSDGELTAEPVVATDTPMTFSFGERCLVCLCDYEASEQVRQLSCRHVYHRECIDEWLTTGRNSCPMCRGQGVEEKANAATSTTDAAITEPQAA